VRCELRFAAACALASACWHQAVADTTQGGDTKLHLEACTKWSEQNGSFGFTNTCSEPVALLFIELNGPRRFDRLIKPNERFDVDMPKRAVEAAGWLFTACPEGYVPSVPFTAEHLTQIVKSQYECVRK